MCPNPAPPAKTPKLQEGRPARHLLPSYRESEEERGSERGAAAPGSCRHPSLARRALTPSPFSQEKGGDRHHCRGEIVLTWESGAGGRKHVPALSASDRLWAALPLTSWGAFESWEKKQLRFAHPSAVLPSAPLLSPRDPLPTLVLILQVAALIGPTLSL